MSRVGLVYRLAELVGLEVLEIEDRQEGWPALATLHTGDGDRRLALFVSEVTLSHRGRDDVERRFQNPIGKPLQSVAGRTSVLVGLWEHDPYVAVDHPIVMTADAERREGRTTRVSVFVPLTTLTDALATGYATNLKVTDELVRCMAPALLPAAIVAAATGVEPAEDQVRTAVEASGLLDVEGDPAGDPAVDRARRAATTLVRDARFSRRVLDAYGGRCAMCGLGLSIVQGAHIYPASAPGSPDEPWNGLALCANHHAAFDRHLVAVRTSTGEIVFRPDVLEEAILNQETRTFIDGTLTVLRPATPGNAPRADMFERRYAYFAEEDYVWLVDA